MTNGKYKSLGFILWRILKNPLCSELTYEEAAEYSLEYIRLLGAPLAYNDKIEKLQLVDFKAELPCDLLNIRGVRYSDCGFGPNQGIALRYASDTYHMNNDDYNCSTEGYIGEFTYTVQKGIIFASQQDGEVEIAYKGISLDEDGYPLIPDDERVLLGLEYYILHRYLEPLWLLGKITDKAFNYVSQQRDWYFGSGAASLNTPSIDQMETIANSINRLIINTTAHENFYRNMGRKEYIKQYS